MFTVADSDTLNINICIILIFYHSCQVFSFLTNSPTSLCDTPTRVRLFCMGSPHQEEHQQDSSVSAMLDRLQWPTLQQRRKSARLAMLWKINNNIVHADLIQSKLLPLSKRQQRGHDQQFVQIKCQTQYRQFSFLPREWNELPPKAVAALTFDTIVSRVSQLAQ